MILQKPPKTLPTGLKDHIFRLSAPAKRTLPKISSEDFPPEVNEFEKAGLEPAKSYKVRVPRVARAKAWLECRLLKHEELFGYDLIFGRVL